MGTIGLGLALFVGGLGVVKKSGVFVESFTGASNVGLWTYGFGVSTPSSGGNPDWYLRTEGLDTFAPQLRTRLDSIFTGDYRARNVTALGVDLVTFAVDFSAGGRPLSLLLIEDNGTPGDSSDDWAAYTIGGSNIPLPGEGWKSFSFAVPSQSATLPAGWNVIQFGPNSPANPDWNQVITDVDEVRFFYGDPELFFIFQQWTLGADNVRIEETPPPACVADANGDGRTDAADLSVLLAQFGASVPVGTGADFNDDGAVNAADLSVLLGSFGCGT